MINAAIVGLGWWGKTLVEALADGSDTMRFTAAMTRTLSPEVEAFAEQHALRLASSYEAVLADPTIRCGRTRDASLRTRQADHRGGGSRETRLL